MQVLHSFSHKTTYITQGGPKADLGRPLIVDLGISVALGTVYVEFIG